MPHSAEGWLQPAHQQQGPNRDPREKINLGRRIEEPGKGQAERPHAEMEALAAGFGRQRKTVKGEDEKTQDDADEKNIHGAGRELRSVTSLHRPRSGSRRKPGPV